MNLVLTGYRCTGKTSIGKRLAERLGLAFYDSDALIWDETGLTVQEIVETGDWPAFRAEEKKIIARLALQDNCVIALGGGAVLDPENVSTLKVNGRIVWLTADIGTILERMARDGASTAQRPPLEGTDSSREIILILEERTPLYEAAADLTVDTSHRGLDEIVEEILTVK